MKILVIALAIVGSSFGLTSCCGSDSGCCADTATYTTTNCCGDGYNNGW